MSESEKTSPPTQSDNHKPKRRRRKPRQNAAGEARRQQRERAPRAAVSQDSETPAAPPAPPVSAAPAVLASVPPRAGQWRFQDFDLPTPLMRAINDLSFQYCTPIQGEALKHTLLGGDVVGKAQTGTGKTAAFLISIFTYFLEEERPDGQKPGAPRALIVAPTRELALQIEKDARQLARYTDLEVVSAVGGMEYQKQQQQLKKTLDVLIATPGRLLDFHQKRDVDLSQVEVLVLDEADRMLSMGFIPDVKRIIRSTPKKEERQTFLFSATFTQDILNLASQWTFDAAYVEIASESQTATNVEQRVYMVSDRDKVRLLTNLLKQDELDRVMVFANQKYVVRELDETLRKAGINVAMLSGDVPQRQRIRTLEEFREGKVAVLVATDVAGRGIHISDVSHVINYTLPEDPEDYVHRIGRTGRAGAKGTSISFVGEEDAFALPEIESFIKDKLPCEHPPEGLL
ncbi:ATP-dependent RNA helicase RhlB [Halotalea alkalilenta]|uniref:ATP-dependent RNA helicase RhlB n=1 Tax=Halotalea alkalilenta TaxID=376489 RepID=A0A172YFC0_9GAMM|nr:ATP-dependent RNA helicase RhlB [Halotalea alkalilenta]ANF57970.1 ATP-dependent RNA helicase RhlB [Halotalea alkalilenta]